MTHPITPPPELLQQWAIGYWNNPGESIGEGEKYIATKSAQWGADQELEACCAWFQEFYETELWVKRDLKEFRTARRPKPPSLKEQALDALNLMLMFIPPGDQREQGETIRKALEALPND